MLPDTLWKSPHPSTHMCRGPLVPTSQKLPFHPQSHLPVNFHGNLPLHGATPRDTEGGFPKKIYTPLSSHAQGCSKANSPVAHNAGRALPRCGVVIGRKPRHHGDTGHPIRGPNGNCKKTPPSQWKLLAPTVSTACQLPNNSHGPPPHTSSSPLLSLSRRQGFTFA